MQLQLTQKYAIEAPASKQFHRIVLLESGTIVAFLGNGDACCLLWADENGITEHTVDLIACDPFHTPALFHFQGYAGIYASGNDFVVLYHESDRAAPLKLPIRNSLPQIGFPRFNKPLSNYGYAGNTDDSTVPILFRDAGLLPVYIAQLHIDLEKVEASWQSLGHWGNKIPIALNDESFQRPGKPFAILHALRKHGAMYAFGIGARDGGYLKPGMEYSDLAVLDDAGTVSDTLFSMGRLYKESKKGGKECIFSSSGRYAILTPVYKADDWKNEQRLFDLQTRELMEVKLPKEAAGLRIIDHHHDRFLLADNYTNLIFARTANIAVAVALP